MTTKFAAVGDDGMRPVVWGLGDSARRCRGNYPIPSSPSFKRPHPAVQNVPRVGRDVSYPRCVIGMGPDIDARVRRSASTRCAS